MAAASHLVEVNPAIFLDPTITTILAGPDRSRYAVHKALLCQKSGYFTSAYNTSMKEAIEDTFTISDLPDEAFRSLITWLYTGKVFLQPGQDSSQYMAIASASTGDQSNDNEADSDGNSEAENDILEWSEDGSIRDGWYEDSDRDPDSSDDEMLYEDEDEDEKRIEQAGEMTSGQRSEAFKIAQVFPGFLKLDELDVYQLSCLLRMHEGEACGKEFREKCKAMLETKLEETAVGEDSSKTDTYGQDEIDTYDRLIDIYILADRFDIQGLRIDIMNLIEGHKAEQGDYVSNGTLPELSTIAKACENLPPTSDLRLWLVHGLAFECSAQAEDLEILPKDFLADVLATMGQKAKWLWTKDDWPQYQDECLCHAHESQDEVKRRLVNGVGDQSLRGR
ncbi:hypothetical protein AC578_754 [Pseudocercospora eumusae]|uniref:BTB domain-containing protein n=1 Tax=Pseudocercospora eumusae TaxID=321146 RepID=A0A139HN39_9PEZI|nr:hypothetical protein AC578_754 [Pseudocercospora eumusae]